MNPTLTPKKKRTISPQLPLATVDKLAALADLLGISQNAILDRAITAMYEDRESLALLELQERKKKLLASIRK